MSAKKPSPKLPSETKLVLSAAKKFVTKPDKTRLGALVAAVIALPEEQYEEVDLGEEEE